MPRKRPHLARLDQVRISRNGEDATIEFDDSAAAHEKRTGADLVLDGSYCFAVFYCFRNLRNAVVEIGFELTG